MDAKGFWFLASDEGGHYVMLVTLAHVPGAGSEYLLT